MFELSTQDAYCTVELLFGNKLGPLMRTSRRSDGFVARESGKGVCEGSVVGREVESVGEGVNGDGK